MPYLVNKKKENKQQSINRTARANTQDLILEAPPSAFQGAIFRERESQREKQREYHSWSTQTGK